MLSSCRAILLVKAAEESRVWVLAFCWGGNLSGTLQKITLGFGLLDFSYSHHLVLLILNYFVVI